MHRALHTRVYVASVVGLFSTVEILYGSAGATNGLAMSGYGARSAAMGGAAMAFDVGNSNVMNNPAAFGYRDPGTVLGAGLTAVRPEVSVEDERSGMEADSLGDSYLSPSLSLIHTTSGGLTYGAAFLAQGGMGAEYGGDTFLAPSGEQVRSEVSFGRLMVPLAYDANDWLNVAVQADYLVGNMDLQMDLPEEQLEGFMEGQGGTIGGSMPRQQLEGMVSDAEYARLEFNDGREFRGEAQGEGLAGKIGATVRVTPDLTVGAAYHNKSSMGDWTTGSENARFRVGEQPELQGEVAVEDFEWPATYGLGIAYEHGERVTLSADVTRIAWSDVLDSFSLSFEASESEANPEQFRGEKLELELLQEWEDQTVVSLGGEFQATDALSLRGGVNIADSPVPEEFVNHLFPAIIENHYTAGLGYAFTERSHLGLAVIYAPQVEATNRAGATTTHSQLNARGNYSYRF